ncbi:acetate--CoA ligase family protein [Candidatus Micrarchaeota archaeon]|nr:acetate--CoA ligase family protein [Candidatus Micrarchaeota archaeon]
MSMLKDFSLLEKYKFKLLPYKIAKNEEDAVKHAKYIGFPVALKIISPQITHKTDVGGVRIKIKNSDMLRHAYRDIVSSAEKSKAEVKGVLVQKMARKGIELIIGGKEDPQFGHMVVLGLGGVYVEIFRDITGRICPISKQDVREMVGELKSHPILTGVRGQKAVNMNTLEDIMLKTCRFMEKEKVKELDLNPVIFDSKGADIVDARIRK